MGRSLERLKPIGFWSYAQQDDKLSNGRLSRLCDQLSAELQLIYGKQTITIFRDVAAIPPGTEWEKAIDAAIDQATFFIPILTPSFFESEWCCKEVSKFLVREAEINAAHPELQGRRRIFPIRYIDSHNADPFDLEVFVALGKLQETNFQSLRRETDQSPLVRDKIVILTDTVAELLQIRVQRPPTATEIEEERQQREAIVEQNRLTEAKRLAEEQRRHADAAAEEARRAERAREEQQAAEEQHRIAEANRLVEEQRLREEALAADARRAQQEETLRQAAAAAEARRLELAERDRQRAAEHAAERAAAMRRLIARLRQPPVAIAALVLAILALVVFFKSSQSYPVAASGYAVEEGSGVANVADTASMAASLDNVAVSPDATDGNGQAADVQPQPSAAIHPDWIKGSWEVVGGSEGCVAKIAISYADNTLSFGRSGSAETVDTKFSFDPASPNILLTNGNRYEWTGSGEIRMTARKTGKESRLRSCVP